MQNETENRRNPFYGWSVVRAAFVLAVFGWGLGFYGPPIFLSVIRETHGWSLALISAAVSLHFLAGAITGANLYAAHRRFGTANVTKAGALCAAAGITGWALANSPWELFAAALLSGTGWGTMSAAALNAIVSPWFARARPAALGMAYNGGSIGGIIFSPLWVAAIGAFGFLMATSIISTMMLITLWLLASRVFSRTPESMGLRPDGDEQGAPAATIAPADAKPLPGALLWRDRKFITLCAGTGLGLFAQIGLMAHLFSLLVPALGAQQAGLALALITVMAIATRSLLGWLMPLCADRRLIICGGYVAQCAGSLAFMLAGGANLPLLLTGVVLFGAGFGNAVSMPPLIAQEEFRQEEVARVTSLVVGIAQGGYAIAPAFYGLIREFTVPAASAATGEAPVLFAAAAVTQGLAVVAYLSGRRR